MKTTGSLEKWISMEFHKLNKNLVERQTILADLLDMERPTAKTRNGEEYQFDINALQSFAGSIPQKLHKRLKLPIFFFKNVKVADSCYLIDELAVEAFKHTDDLNQMYRFREKKLWVSLPLAYGMANKYPTLIQFVMH